MIRIKDLRLLWSNFGLWFVEIPAVAPSLILIDEALGLEGGKHISIPLNSVANASVTGEDIFEALVPLWRVEVVGGGEAGVGLEGGEPRVEEGSW